MGKQISVDPAVCAGCGNCLARCRLSLIRVVNKVATIQSDRCDFCGRCADACNYCAINIEEDGSTGSP